MSVYTIVEHQSLEKFLQHYNVGKLITHQGISAGIENTNYFVTTSKGEFVLTLFEQLSTEELPYFLELMAYLSERGVPSAHPIANNQQHYLSELNQKSAVLVERLSGENVTIPSLTQCCALGKALGHFHAISPQFPLHRANAYGPSWWHTVTKRLLPYLSTNDVTLLQTELHFQDQCKHLDLPCGVTHADLFRDNALFKKDKLSGIIDFYVACNDVLIYDLAITLNDWCSLPDGHLEQNRMRAILDNYRQERELTSMEIQAFPTLLRAAALRFWLSRLQDLHFPRAGEITHTKDPNVFREILRTHITTDLSAIFL